MTPKKRWPNEADHARTEAIARARKIIAQMEPMKDALEEGKPVSSMELSIRMGRMSDAANKIIELLVAFGPQKFME
jgi:hypothetical protein